MNGTPVVITPHSPFIHSSFTPHSLLTHSMQSPMSDLEASSLGVKVGIDLRRLRYYMIAVGFSITLELLGHLTSYSSIMHTRGRIYGSRKDRIQLITTIDMIYILIPDTVQRIHSQHNLLGIELFLQLSSISCSPSCSFPPS